MDLVTFCLNVFESLMTLVKTIYDFFSYTFWIPGVGNVSMWLLISGVGFVALLLVKLFL